MPYMIDNLWDIYSDEMPDVIREILGCQALQRIRYVGMNCGMNYTSFPFYGEMEPYSRYEHSVGCALILWHFTHDAKAALAGLFHDCATPAFAHTIDFLNNDHIAQESTENGTAEIIAADPLIQAHLEKYGLFNEDVNDYHLYPLADNNSPRLCADRLEYMLGCLFHYHLCGKETIREFYEDLQVLTNEEGIEELGFQTKETAVAFTRKALECSYIFTNDEDRYGMQSLAMVVKEAIEKGILNRADLYTDEIQVITKLKQSDAADMWKHFTGLHRIRVLKEKPDEAGWINIQAKKRYVDPLCNNIRVSAMDEETGRMIETFRKRDMDVYMKEDE